MTILLIAIFTASFFHQNYIQNQSNPTNQPSPIVYNNLSIELSETDDDSDDINDPEMVQTVLAIAVLFVICWLPFFTTVSQSEEVFDYTIKKYAFLLAIIKSSLNPLLLFLVNSEFKLLFNKIKFWS